MMIALHCMRSHVVLILDSLTLSCIILTAKNTHTPHAHSYTHTHTYIPTHKHTPFHASAHLNRIIHQHELSHRHTFSSEHPNRFDWLNFHLTSANIIIISYSRDHCGTNTVTLFKWHIILRYSVVNKGYWIRKNNGCSKETLQNNPMVFMDFGQKRHHQASSLQHPY